MTLNVKHLLVVQNKNEEDLKVVNDFKDFLKDYLRSYKRQIQLVDPEVYQKILVSDLLNCSPLNCYIQNQLESVNKFTSTVLSVIAEV